MFGVFSVRFCVVPDPHYCWLPSQHLSFSWLSQIPVNQTVFLHWNSKKLKAKPLKKSWNYVKTHMHICFSSKLSYRLKWSTFLQKMVKRLTRFYQVSFDGTCHCFWMFIGVSHYKIFIKSYESSTKNSFIQVNVGIFIESGDTYMYNSIGLRFSVTSLTSKTTNLMILISYGGNIYSH